MLKLVYRLDVLGSVAGLAKTWTQPVEITPAQTQTEYFFFWETWSHLAPTCCNYEL